VVLKRIYEHLKAGLDKTRKTLGSSLRGLLTIGRRIDADFLEELEEVLIRADIGVAMTSQIVEDLEAAYKEKKIERAEGLLDFLKAELKKNLKRRDTGLHLPESKPAVILVVGVNGTGKTTSIAKLARFFKKRGKSVLLAASDTFRAAATEQLSIWAERADVDIVKHQHGADPAAVTYDACDAAIARRTDVLIVDTAGRLHTKQPLMRELQKIEKVVAKKIPGAPHEVLLVLDATTGQNAISQANLFRQAVKVSGIFLAKLDGTAKGGIVLAINNQLDIPVKFVGIGEGLDDIEVFDAESFVEALFE